jgi:hypothetical protein
VTRSWELFGSSVELRVQQARHAKVTFPRADECAKCARRVLCFASSPGDILGCGASGRLVANLKAPPSFAGLLRGPGVSFGLSFANSACREALSQNCQHDGAFLPRLQLGGHIIERVGDRMSRLSFGSLICGTLSATLCLSFAVSPVASQESALSTTAPVRCDQEAASDAQGQGPLATRCESQGEADDRSYLLETASPGDTMMRQRPLTAIGRLNPEFVTRLASAIREARETGLPGAGIFSAYRPPGFGVGGFADKFKSLHAYGLAVDMSGIGEPGSREARVWHDIAARHGVFCPYGADSKTEWNHCQATPVKSVMADNPLRKTITADGPLVLDQMFKVGSAIIDDLQAAIRSALVVNRTSTSGTVKSDAVRTARASASEHVVLKAVREARSGRDALIRHAGKAKAAPIAVASATHREKPHAEAAIAPRARETHQAAHVPQGRRGPTRRRSHLA